MLTPNKRSGGQNAHNMSHVALWFIGKVCRSNAHELTLSRLTFDYGRFHQIVAQVLISEIGAYVFSIWFAFFSAHELAICTHS